jgi:hypothetical protein
VALPTPVQPEVPPALRSTLVAMRVRVDPVNHLVEVEGVNISDSIRRATVDLQAGRPAEVFLEVAAGKLAPEVLEVDGVIHVVREAEDHRFAIMTWLESVDPEALERAVLADADLSQSTAQAFLQELTKLAANG